MIQLAFVTLSLNPYILIPCRMPSSGHCADSGNRYVSGWPLAFTFFSNMQTDHHSAPWLKPFDHSVEFKSREPGKKEEGNLIAV